MIVLMRYLHVFQLLDYKSISLRLVAQWVVNRARKSRTTLQNKVRLKVLPEQLTLFVNTSVAFKNASCNSCLLYHPNYCSEIHALSYSSNEKYR